MEVQTAAELEDRISAMDDCSYLLLDGIGETGDLTLQLRLTEAKLQPPILRVKGNSELAQLIVGARPVRTDSTCRRFRITFDHRHMIYYAVLNESYSRFPDSSEVFTGKWFRRFVSSQLLQFIKRTTNASETWPGPPTHYQIVCQNHIVDVIATQPPSVTTSSDAAQLLAALGGSEPDLKLKPRRRMGLLSDSD